MAEFTQNYNLRKDSQDNFYDVDVFNNNFDIIDQNMKQIEIESKNKDGGNADTLKGKHIDYFATASHIHNNAKTDTSGFLSAEDKIKLNSISEGANKTIVDNTLSSTSINPIQNKVVNTALSGKAPISHTHTISQITDLSESFPTNGGNADTVDNKHASDFINAFNVTSNVNWNTLTNTGIYNIKTTGGTNNPTSHHGALYVNNTVGTPFQMFIPDGDTEYIFKRRLTGE